MRRVPDDRLVRAERDIEARLAGRPFDFESMAVVLNIYRAATMVRNHMEQTVLAKHRLSWTAFKVLWVLWIWGEQEMGHAAEEANVSRTTMTGVVGTLERRGWVSRTRHPASARTVLVDLTPTGTAVIEDVFPAFNAEETFAASVLTQQERRRLPKLLRKIINGLEEVDGPAVRSPLLPADA
ncbi:MAG: MarR family winged helix-turn-helix transcriptional regulator [Ilumatobacteraceae bacterium]